ncbi:MAG: DNA-binding transcriptional activator PunR [Parashewanella sp.]
MLSEAVLNLIDEVSRLGSFTAAAKKLNKVPSAISYTIKQAEDELGTALFVRHHRSVSLTPAGEYFVQQSRQLLQQMQQVKLSTQRVANNWRPTISITLDCFVRADKISALIGDFYKAFDDVELTVKIGVFNGVWESLASGESDLAIGATTSIPNSGYFSYKEMGNVEWCFCVSPKHLLAKKEQALTQEDILPFPVVCVEDTAQNTTKRELWRLQNQRRIVVPDWIRAINCASSGLGVAYLPKHLADLFIKTGRLVTKELQQPLAKETCCVAWKSEQPTEALQWLLSYLGDTENMQKQWLS